MEINAQDVIDRLTAKIGKLEGDLAVSNVQIEALQKENEKLQSNNTPMDNSQPLEGEVVG